MATADKYVREGHPMIDENSTSEVLVHGMPDGFVDGRDDAVRSLDRLA